jgi:RHS repeat-associated protein
MNTDRNGTVVAEQGHYPFGEFWYSSSATTKWRFTSYERDSESGNDYAIFRYHSNRLGRFLTPDPLAGSVFNPQSLNRYAYVVNDPVNLIDPLGLEPKVCWCVEEVCTSVTGCRCHRWECQPDAETIFRRIRRRLIPISLAQWDDLHLRLDRRDRSEGEPGPGGETPDRVNPLKEGCLIIGTFEGHLNRQPPSRLPGVDLRTAQGAGTDVFSPVSGTVDRKLTRSTGKPGGLTNQVVIREAQTGLLIYLVHTAPEKGIPDQVSAGDLVGQTDKSGKQTADHLHVAVRDKDGNLIDPERTDILQDCKRKE